MNIFKYFKKNETVIKHVDNLKFYLKPSYGGLSEELLHADRREMGFMDLLESNIKEGMVCFDLGANIGYTTLYMLKNAGKTGFVYSIEPDPRNLELLKINIKENGFKNNCEINSGVISDEDDFISFYMASRPNISSIDSHGKSIKKINVKSYRFSTFFQKRRFPEFIKMDVEGAEVIILEDAFLYFKENKYHTKILFECHQYFYNKHNVVLKFQKILNDYLSIGFKIKYLISTPSANPEIFQMKGYSPVKIYDFGSFQRGLYENVESADAIDLICNYHHEKESHRVVRAAMLSRE